MSGSGNLHSIFQRADEGLHLSLNLFERESHDLSSEATPLDAVVAHFGHRLDNPFFIDFWSVPHGRVKVNP